MKRHQVEKIPKVELHCHLDGSVPLTTLKRLAKKEGLSPNSMEEAVLREPCKSLKEYLRCFEVILQVLQTEENLISATYDTIKEIAKENVRYLELRFAPLFHLEKGLSIEQVIESVIKGTELAMLEEAIHVNILICGMRHHSEEMNLNLLDTLSKINSDRLVGFDFAGDEAAVGNEVIAPIVQAARLKGLNITLHSGECGCPHQVVEAIKIGASRIGHGVAIKDDPEALALCVEKQVLLEMCPTSNLQTRAIESIEVYPIRDFMEKGVLCSINTDNRTVSNTTLTDEYLLLNQYFKLSYQEFLSLNLNAIQAAFTSPQIKKEVSNVLEAGYGGLNSFPNV